MNHHPTDDTLTELRESLREVHDLHPFVADVLVSRAKDANRAEAELLVIRQAADIEGDEDMTTGEILAVRRDAMRASLDEARAERDTALANWAAADERTRAHADALEAAKEEARAAGALYHVTLDELCAARSELLATATLSDYLSNGEPTEDAVREAAKAVIDADEAEGGGGFGSRYRAIKALRVALGMPENPYLP